MTISYINIKAAAISIATASLLAVRLLAIEVRRRKLVGL